MYNYVVSAQKPTAVTHSLVGNFTGPNDLNLIVSKATRIEIHLLTADGLQPQLDVSIYGRISSMQLFRPETEKQDLLFILTEKYKFCVLYYDAKQGEIITRANGDVQDKVGRQADIGQLGVIDPSGRVIGLHLYDGLFKVIPIQNGVLNTNSINLRLEETSVIDIKFLYAKEPTIAVLYQDAKDARHVKTFEIVLKEKEKDLAEGPWSQAHLEGGASILIPVPAPLGGVLIVGEQTITYHGGQSSNIKTIETKTTQIKAYAKVDPDGSRYLLGDYLGRLSVLILQHDGSKVQGLKLEHLGETSIPSCLSYLDNGFIFVGSTLGDSQLVRLNPDPNDQGVYTTVIESYTNLGPIVDFCVVDLERQGQGQVVTCSGGFHDGSLRVIRNGIGINEQATIELQGVKGIWSLRGSFSSEYDKYLLVSFIGESRLLAINEEELDEAEIPGFTTTEQTITCGNVINDQLVQVTTSNVSLVNCVTLELVHQWKPPTGSSINVAAVNASQIVVACGGGNLVYMEIVDNKLVEKTQAKLDYDISCLNINPLQSDSTRSEFVAVGLWTDISIRILRLPSLEQLCKEVLGGEIIPRSALFCNLEGVDYLFCALGDGHLFNFRFDSATYKLSERKKLSLATKPILLNTFKSKGTTNVFAASDRPTVIYSSNKKLLYSSISLREVNYMCPFNTESFPESLAISTENSLTIGTVDDIQKLHIRSVPLKEMPRRIAHQESTQSFCVLTIRFEGESESGFVHLIDDQTFEMISSYKLHASETPCSVTSYQLGVEKQDYFVVGTAYSYPEEEECSRGRILVFSVSDKKLVLVSEKEEKSAVYSLAGINNKIVAAVGNKVQVYSWEDQQGNKALSLICTQYGHIVSLYLATRGEFVIVGDLMKSISLLNFKADGQLEEIAKDPSSNWCTSVEFLDDETFIGAENSFNLFVVKKNTESEIDEERARLETVGEMHLGEFVNRFRHGSLVMKGLTECEALNPTVPTLLYGSVNGVIGVIASLTRESFSFFEKLQQNMTKVVKGVGGFTHEHFRSFSNEKKTADGIKNFIDGDLIESFLELKKESMEEVVKGLNVSVDEVCKRIETLIQALH